MASAQTFHLLLSPPVANAPGPNTGISATAPTYGVLTTQLLDPASNPTTQAQVVQAVHTAVLGASTNNIVFGRWITRQLPAQTIGAGNWVIYGAGRQLSTQTGSFQVALWGGCLAQWRAGIGVVARFFDSPTTGTTFGSVQTAEEFAVSSTIAGGALTLQQNDQLVFELWSLQVVSSSQALGFGLLLGGSGQYVQGRTAGTNLLNTDAGLIAPAAITYL